MYHIYHIKNIDKFINTIYIKTGSIIRVIPIKHHVILILISSKISYFTINIVYTYTELK